MRANEKLALFAGEEVFIGVFVTIWKLRFLATAQRWWFSKRPFYNAIKSTQNYVSDAHVSRPTELFLWIIGEKYARLQSKKFPPEATLKSLFRKPATCGCTLKAQLSNGH
ncbi:hypothetical protein KIN20_002404 [Parelaphostrongylus tenuis]|uniref:Uncharacterized protein n=1 Tax=Parelaphostrongylus tenuis TaxID=148309 RepID=A0AAD5QD01_PARTN|nr:hypothetical protein KIN20_002404 [Parelaphostrongylus tenuis]